MKRTFDGELSWYMMVNYITDIIVDTERERERKRWGGGG